MPGQHSPLLALKPFPRLPAPLNVSNPTAAHHTDSWRSIRLAIALRKYTALCNSTDFPDSAASRSRSFQRHPSSAPIHSTAMAIGRAFAARHDAALVTLAVLVAMALLVAGADAGRWNLKHHHHHRGHASPPAPPGFDQPTAAPSPPFVGDGPAASPFTQSWSYRGSDEPVADSAPSGAPADSPLPWDGSPKAAPLQESGLY